MTTWQITIKCILCCSMRSQMRWKKSKNRISVMPKTSSSPPNKRQKNSISPQNPKSGGERSNAAPSPASPIKRRRAKQCRRTQAVCRRGNVTRALRSARGCNTNRHAEDSWRSHVHRTYTAQRVQSFKLQTANVGGRGGRPSSFSGGFKGGILFGYRHTPSRREPYVVPARKCKHYILTRSQDSCKIGVTRTNTKVGVSCGRKGS